MRILAALIACVCVLLACGTSQTLSGGGAAAPQGLAPLPSAVQRSSALDAVRARSENVGRIDRIEAKLLTLQEYYDVAGPLHGVAADPKASPRDIGGIGVMGDADKRIVWIVAVSGEVWPQLRVPMIWGQPPFGTPAPSATPNTPYRWGLFAVDAARGGLMAVADAGTEEVWPPVFARLPDHPVAAGVAPVVDPCATLLHVPDVPNPSRFRAQTLVDVTANLTQDLAWMRLLQEIAGLQPNPMQDPRVPRCRVDLLVMGTPYFARAYPATHGMWFVPLRYGSDVILTAFVDVDASGTGSLAGNRGGAIPVPAEADARNAATLPDDPVVSAELVLAHVGCATKTVMWRLVRASGVALYFALDVYGATPPGTLFEEKDVLFSTVSPVRYAGAC